MTVHASRGAASVGVATVDRRFDAVIFAWEGTAVTGKHGSPGELRALVERLCAHGMHVAVVANARIDDVDGRLGVRPTGPGRLLLAVDGGAEIHEVDAAGPHVLRPRDAIGDARAAILAELWCSGVGPSLVVVAGGAREGLPRGVVHLAADREGLAELLSDQLERRLDGEVPGVDLRPGWSLSYSGIQHERERAVETLLTLADGAIGTSGAPLFGHPSATPGVVVAGVYRGEGPGADLIDAPRWERLPVRTDHEEVWRALDLRTGVLAESVDNETTMRSVRFSSIARPGTAALRVTSTPALPSGPALTGNDDGFDTVQRPGGAPEYAVIEGKSRAAVAAAAHDSQHVGQFDRVAVYVAQERDAVDPAVALERLAHARAAGFDRLLAEHRAAWGARWTAADVRVAGDDELQLATRVALFHLMGSVGDAYEAAVGARGLSGHAYRGHVFWDSDVFVLPFLAATHPRAARAMVEYRVRRLPAAREAARAERCRGARFPWESATFGNDVTPPWVRDQTGQVVPIRTGESEIHIVADVAWASCCYADWSGDAQFAAGPGHRILVETAQYWASRIRVESGGAHIYGVIGPDEYHEPVDDNMFTNVMARWNLRRAAASVRAHGGVDDAEVSGWLDLADRLVDGYDHETGRYEQFAGFDGLESVLIADIAPRRPIAADLLLGRDRVRGAQVIKQPDVLMALHLVPDECAADSLEPNLDFYEPRTAHGSSLSPGVHASVLARARRFDDALRWLRVAADVDLADVTNTTAAGLHLATMGSVWQAFAWGFVGVRARPDALAVDPCMPDTWEELELSVRYHDIPVRVLVRADSATITADGPVTVAFGPAGSPIECGPGSVTIELER